jgi:FdhD protein
MDEVFSCAARLEETQVYYSRTRGSHAAMIFGADLKTLAFAEDVGRHNALDKAIGKLVLDDDIGNAVMVVLSSRLSYELVQKAARARLPIIVSKSRPTALAVEMGKTLNITLVCNPRPSDLIIFSGEQRIVQT